MLFSSLVFLSIFLPVLLLVYYTGPKHLRNIVLLVASLFFYGWGEPYMLSVMVVSIVVNYSMAMCIGATGKIFLRKIILLLAVAFNLGLLFVFKYMDFFIINVNRLIGGDIGLLKIAMPIGISFYTFQAISYLLDVYRRDVPAERSLLHVGLYITFFPQLIAGPIVKFHEISRQIVFRTESMRSFAVGMQRFLVGLAKKVLIANVMGEFVDSIIVGGGSGLCGGGCLALRCCICVPDLLRF